MKRCYIFLITAILLAVISSTTVYAAGSDLPDTTLARSVYVYNTDSGIALFSKNAQEAIAPASSVKLMTAILAYEHYQNDFDKKISVPKEAIDITVGNNIGLVPGEEVSVRELLIALIAGGANDAANTFAIEIAGSLDVFCELMNKKAKEIGALDTVYKNASGIDADGMVTTAKDTALITAYAYKLSGFREYAMITRYVMDKTNKSASRVIHNRNYLLSTHIEPRYYDPDAIGMNSGYTQEGGFCTVCAAEEDGLTYIFVILGAAKDENGNNSSFNMASELIDWATSNYGYINVLDPGEIVYEVPVRLAKNVDYVIVSPQTKLEYFLPLDTDIKNEVLYEIHLDEKELTAPLYEGQVVGKINVIYKSDVIANADLITKSSVSASTFLKMLDYLKNLFKSKQVRVAFIVFAILFISYLFLSYVQFKNTYRNRNNRK